MIYTRLSAAEAAAMINDQDTIGLSGFTPMEYRRLLSVDFLREL